MSLNQHISPQAAAKALVTAWCSGQSLSEAQIAEMLRAGLIGRVGWGWQLSYEGGMVKARSAG